MQHYGYTIGNNTFMEDVWSNDTVETVGNKTTVVLHNGIRTITMKFTARQMRMQVEYTGLPTQGYVRVYKVSKHGYVSEKGEYLS